MGNTSLRKKNKAVLASASLTVLLLILAGCTSQLTGNAVSGEHQPTIGVIMHLSGNDYASVGQAMKEGIDLAVNEANAQGGINGQQIRIIYEDDQYNTLKANSAAQKLIHLDQVDAAIISTYTETMAVGPVFEQEKTPLVTLWDSSPAMEGIGSYTFGIGGWAPSAGARIADYAYKELGLRRIAIINNEGEWSETIANVYFAQRFTALGGVIVSHEAVPESEVDFRGLITKAMSKNPDAIFAPLSTHLDLFSRQAKEIGFTKPLLTSDALTQQQIDASLAAADGMYFTTLVAPENDVQRAFAAKYKAAYGKDSDMILFNGLGYDGALAIIEAMKKDGVSREAIKNGLYNIKGLPASLGLISFNEKGSAPRFESVFQVRNGTMVKIAE